MADQYGLFWNSVSGDRTYDADSFSEWLGKFFTTGVFNGDLQVTPDSGMVVNVGSGYANINGKVRFFDTDTSITISPASGVYPRIDTIVVRADYTNREITLEYVTGSYSGNDPQPTAPTRNASMYEIVLAQILVSAGSTEVTARSITDTRPDSTVCGWVTGTVDSVAVDQLTEQAKAQFEVWFDHMKDQLSEDAAGNLQLQIDALDTRIDGIDSAIGDTDISAIGDGTVTGAVSALNKGLTDITPVFSGVGFQTGRLLIGDLLIQWGYGTIIPRADTATSKVITFPLPYKVQPWVGLTMNASVAGDTWKGVGYTQLSMTQFTAWVYRTNTTECSFGWIAIGQAA